MKKLFFGKVRSKIINAYLAEWRFFKSNLWFWFKLSIIILLVSVVFFSLLFSYNRDITEIIRKRADSLPTKWKQDLLESDPLKSVMDLFLHNVGAFLIQIVSGLIPFVFLPFFITILNGLVEAIFLVAAKLAGVSVLGTYFIGIFPHGIFEEIGGCYSASLGIFLCIESSKKVIHKWRGNSVPFLTIGKQICRSCILIIIPLYAIAAIVEGLITPLLVRTLGKTVFPF